MVASLQQSAVYYITSELEQCSLASQYFWHQRQHDPQKILRKPLHEICRFFRLSLDWTLAINSVLQYVKTNYWLFFRVLRSGTQPHVFFTKPNYSILSDHYPLAMEIEYLDPSTTHIRNTFYWLISHKYHFSKQIKFCFVFSNNNEINKFISCHACSPQLF